jgi:hypothetical protein
MCIVAFSHQALALSRAAGVVPTGFPRVTTITVAGPLVIDALETGLCLSTNLPAATAFPVTARVTAAADSAADHRAPASIAAALAIEAGLTLLAAVIMCWISVLAAHPFG